MEVRKYQQECWNSIKREYEAGCTKQLITMPTGTGKRYCSVESIKHLGIEGRILFLAHNEELISQARDEFEIYYPFNVGIVKAQQFEIDKKITIASPQTLHRRLDRFDCNHYQYIIIDECHLYAAETFCKSIHYFKPNILTGWTASPHRMDNLSLSNIFDKIVYSYDILTAINEGYLCELSAIRIKTNIDLTKLHKSMGDFNQKELSMSVDVPERNQLIVDKYKQYALGRQAIFFGVDIKHCQNMVEVFKENGIKADLIVSDKEVCTDRQLVHKMFRNNNIDVLCNVNICTTGYDYNDVGAVLWGRPTTSLTLWIQGTGRGARLKSPEFIAKHGINDCKILDFVDNCGKHALVNSWTLDNKKEIEDRVFVSKEKKEKLIGERERRNAEIKSKYLHDKKVDLFALPTVKISNSAAMHEPATEKQLEWLKREGVWVEGSEYTKRQASEFISNFQASDKQIEALRRWNYDVSKGCTVAEAKLAFEAIEERRGVKREYSPIKL